MVLQTGDIVTLKKKHPCGSQDWEVLRVGSDIKLRCLGCGHEIMVRRPVIEKSIRTVKKT